MLLENSTGVQECLRAGDAYSIPLPMGEEVLSDRKNSVTLMVLSLIHARGLHGRMPVLIAWGHIMQGPDVFGHG